MNETLTDDQRFPLITQDGRRLLKWMREHPHGPRYTAVCGNRLTDGYLRRVRDYEAELNATPTGWPPGGAPPWLDDFVSMCYREVPFYRREGDRPGRFADIPTLDRAHLSREIWSFVPDSLPLDDLILYATSGTTGQPLTLISHPIVGASYTPLLRAALRLHGIELKAGRGQVCCVLAGYQTKAYTYPSLTPHQDEAGHIKLNLHPGDWRDPDDRARFLDDCSPEIYTGDPIAFAELMRLPLKTRPRALISTAMTLLPGLRRRLEAHFGCPVLDVYSMNEAGPIAAGAGAFHDRLRSGPQGDATPLPPGTYTLLQHRLYVEILDPNGESCPPGVRGEITLTGGLNFYLPLLRYRTNDYAALDVRGSQPVLVGLEGRPPVLYRGADGQRISTLDVTHALQSFALPQFTLHQSRDGGLSLSVRQAGVDLTPVRETIRALFGPAQVLRIEEVDSLETASGKVVQYTSDFAWEDE
jgi:phenylacetate-CoA ligase